MSLPVEMGVSTAGRTKVGNSGLRVAGLGLGQVPRSGRILRRVGPTWNVTSVPGSGVLRGPGISAERRVAIGAVGGVLVEEADVKIKN